jgi:hypothetical protein
VVVFAAVYGRTTGKYGERGIRYGHMEADHAAENLFLQAVALHLADGGGGRRPGGWEPGFHDVIMIPCSWTGRERRERVRALKVITR